MKIIYPPIVEQAYQWAISQGIGETKDEVYRSLVEKGLITETGEPTDFSIENNLVKSFQQKHSRLIDFKKEYPIFMSYPKEEFTQQAGIWYVSQKILSDMGDKMEQKSLDYDESRQVAAYMNFRNYGDPHRSISEVKGCYHPLYTPYDDSMFQVVDDYVAIPKEVIEDIIKRWERGELEINEYMIANLKQLLERLD